MYTHRQRCLLIARENVAMAERILSSHSAATTHDPIAAQRHTAQQSKLSSKTFHESSPKTSAKANTTRFTIFLEDNTDSGVAGGIAKSAAKLKSSRKQSKVERKGTFKAEKDKDKSANIVSSSLHHQHTVALNNYRVSEKQVSVLLFFFCVFLGLQWFLLLTTYVYCILFVFRSTWIAFRA